MNKKNKEISVKGDNIQSPVIISLPYLKAIWKLANPTQTTFLLPIIMSNVTAKTTNVMGKTAIHGEGLTGGLDFYSNRMRYAIGGHLTNNYQSITGMVTADYFPPPYILLLLS